VSSSVKSYHEQQHEMSYQKMRCSRQPGDVIATTVAVVACDAGNATSVRAVSIMLVLAQVAVLKLARLINHV